LMYIPKFEWTRFGTLVFWILYIFLPFNSIIFLYKLRSLPVAGTEETPAAIRSLLWALVILLGLYGFGLLLTPETVTAFWPWKIDAFHGRIYAATFLTPAIGAWVIRRQGAPSERLVLGLTIATLGVLAILGTIWTSATVPLDKQIDYAGIGTWVFFGMNLLCAVAGFALIQSGRKS
jgi:hypothetical protein